MGTKRKVGYPIPTVVEGTPEEMVAFARAVKEWCESREGLRDKEQEFVTRRDFGLLRAELADALTEEAAEDFVIDPPTHFVIEPLYYKHILSWVPPNTAELAGTEIWGATTNDIGEAFKIATTGGATTEYTRSGFNTTYNWYYWIRSITWEGKYSTWVPELTTGGYLVSRMTGIGEAIASSLDVLLGADPDLYDEDTVYTFGDMVRHIDMYEVQRRYVRTNFNLGVNGVEPPDEQYWERAGILAQGDVSGDPTIGIDGNLVVDQSILARSIQTDGLTVGDGSEGTIRVGEGVIRAEGLHESLQNQVLNANVKWEDLGVEKTLGSKFFFYQNTKPPEPTRAAGVISFISTLEDPGHEVNVFEGTNLDLGAGALVIGTHIYRFWDIYGETRIDILTPEGAVGPEVPAVTTYTFDEITHFIHTLAIYTTPAVMAENLEDAINGVEPTSPLVLYSPDAVANSDGDVYRTSSTLEFKYKVGGETGNDCNFIWYPYGIANAAALGVDPDEGKLEGGDGDEYAYWPGATWIDTGSTPIKEYRWVQGEVDGWYLVSTEDSLLRYATDTTKIDGGKIFTGSIFADSIGANQIRGNHIAAEVIEGRHLVFDTIEGDHLQMDSIESSHLKSNIIESRHLSSGVVEAGHLHTDFLTALSAAIYQLVVYGQITSKNGGLVLDMVNNEIILMDTSLEYPRFTIGGYYA